LLLLIAAVGGGVWVGLFQEPDLPATAPTAAEGARAQQKIFDLARGRTRAEPVVLTERELNAFLSRHLAEMADAPLTSVGVRLAGDGVAEFRARLPLRYLTEEPPWSVIATIAPAAWLERPIWLRVTTRPRVEAPAAPSRRRHLRLAVEGFAVGRQRLPAVLLRLVLPPTMLRVLRWPLPDGVGAITIEAGQAVIRPAS
jgi:hypothetical protein